MTALTNEVMDYEGLSLYLKISEGYLRHLVMSGNIPYFKIGRNVRFYKVKIDNWLEELHNLQKTENNNDASFPFCEETQ